MTDLVSVAVSVALCTYNGERYVAAQLASILDQLVRPDEVVVSDDASTDRTVDVVDTFREPFASVGIGLRVLRNPAALGVTANFESAIRATHGELVLLSDQDDVWHPDRVASTTSRFAMQPELDLLFSDARLIDEAGRPLRHGLFDTLEFDPATRSAVDSGQAFAVFLRRNLATGATMAFRRRLLARALPFPHSWVHDEWLAMIAAGTGTLGVIDRQLIDYRQHTTNQIGVQRPGLGTKLSRVFGRRGDRNRRLSARANDLAVHMAGLGDLVSHDIRSEVETKARFETLRSALPSAHWRRVGPILAWDRRGWYRRFSSQGRLDLLRDLLQSAR